MDALGAAVVLGAALDAAVADARAVVLAAVMQLGEVRELAAALVQAFATGPVAATIAVVLAA